MQSFMQVNSVFYEFFNKIDIWMKKTQYFEVKEQSDSELTYEEVYYDVSTFAPKNYNVCRAWYAN